MRADRGTVQLEPDREHAVKEQLLVEVCAHSVFPTPELETKELLGGLATCPFSDRGSTPLAGSSAISSLAAIQAHRTGILSNHNEMMQLIQNKLDV